MPRFLRSWITPLRVAAALLMGSMAVAMAAPPVVTPLYISIGGATGTGGVYKIGDTVTTRLARGEFTSEVKQTHDAQEN